jgi:uncharacterized protein YciI
MIPVLLLTLLPALSPQEAPPLEMMTYQMVLLRKGPGAEPSADAARKMQDAHLANLAALNRKRINLIYGPIVDGGDLRGIAILDEPSAADAKRAFDNDPYVKSGAMVAEVRPWMGPKNWFNPPATQHLDHPNPQDLEPLVLGFLVRAPNRPPAPANAEDIQKGHLAYMDGLHKQGTLLVAGPFLDDGASRGLVIYRVANVDEAKSLAAGDPAVKAGRLVLEPHPWMTFKGILRPQKNPEQH